MYKKISKLLISVLASIVLLLNLSSVVLAADPSPSPAVPGPWYNQDVGQYAGKVFGGDQNQIFGERYTYAQTQWVFYSLFLGILNVATQGKLTGCLTTLATGNATSCINDALKQYSLPQIANPKAASTVGSVMAGIFSDRPISGITYLKNIGRKFSLIPEAKAAPSAGFGYTKALQIVPGIQEMWTAIRNLSYAIFVVIIIVFAFMIMFRIKISPQVVISVQSALPKIAITLILVTFSFAIAGFLIDLMYVVIGIFSLIFSNIQIAGVGGSGALGGVKGYFDLMTTGQGGGIFGLLLMYWVNFFAAVFVVGIGGIFGGWACGATALGAGLGGSGLSVIFFVLYLIAFLVLIVVAVINFFKIVWLLARTFLSIILLTIFAPLQLTLGAIIPAMSFGSWVKSYASKLAVFVGVGVTFVLSLWFLQMAWDIIHNSLPNGVGSACTNNNIYPAGWPPLLGGSPQMVAFLFMLSSFGVFCMIPSVGNMIESFMAGKPFNYGSAIGEAVSPVTAPAGVYLEGVSKNNPGTIGGAVAGAVSGLMRRR